MARRARAPSAACRAAPPASSSALALAACGMAEQLNPFGGGGGAVPAAGAAAVANLEPDSRGVITYATYQVVGRPRRRHRCRPSPSGSAPPRRRSPGATRCRRTTCCAPARCCSCPTASPARPDGLDSGDDHHPAARLDPRPGRGGDRQRAAAPRRRTNPFQNGQTEPLIDPVRHRVESGETAYSIARLYGVSVTALASWNGLGPDLAVRENQELLIPIVSDANRISGARRHPAGPGHAGRRRRRARRRRCPPTSPPRSTPDSPNLGAVPHPARRPAEPAGAAAASAATTTRQSQRRRLRRARGHRRCTAPRRARWR